MKSVETLYQPLDLLQTIGAGNRVRRAGLYSVLKMGEDQLVIKGCNVGANSSANDRLIINSKRLASVVASLK